MAVRNHICCLVFVLACACAHRPAPGGVPPGGHPPPEAPEVTISLVGTSDLHGHVEATTFQVRDRAGAPHEVSRGGLALLGGYVDNQRRRHPVLLLDAGDMFQGTLASNLGEGQAVIDAYNVLGYTAAAIGNHEFDYGPAGPHSVPPTGSDEDPTGALKARIATARFPVLCANLIDDATRKPVTWTNVQPSALVPVHVPGGPDIPIGLIGATSEDTPRTTNVLNLRGLVVAKVVPAAQAEARRLRQQGAAAVVLVVHEGGNCRRFDDPRDLGPCRDDEQRVLTIAEQLKGDVDAVIGGHSHAGVAHFVGPVPVIQSFSGGRAFGRIDLTFRLPAPAQAPVLLRDRTRIFPPTEVCSAMPAPPANAEEGHAHRALCEPHSLQGGDIVPATYEGLPVVASQEVTQALAPYVQRAEAMRGEKIGVQAPQRLTRNYRGESPLGDVLADLIREGAAQVIKKPVDVGFQNGGGIRAELPQGELTYGDVYEVLPFDNRLAILQVPGRALVDLIRGNLRSNGGVLLPSGLIVEARCQDGELQVTLRDSAGKPIRPDQKYTVATSDFLAAGGDSFGPVLRKLPRDAVTYLDDAPPLREVILQAMRRHPVLKAPDLKVPAQQRFHLATPRPVRCGGAAAAPPNPDAPDDHAAPAPN